jgi:hypothetical protein
MCGVSRGAGLDMTTIPERLMRIETQHEAHGKDVAKQFAREALAKDIKGVRELFVADSKAINAKLDEILMKQTHKNGVVYGIAFCITVLGSVIGNKAISALGAALASGPK